MKMYKDHYVLIMQAVDRGTLCSYMKLPVGYACFVLAVINFMKVWRPISLHC